MPLYIISMGGFLQLLQARNVSHDYVRNFLLEMKKTAGRIFVLPDNKFTMFCLEKSGFEWSVINKKYMKQYLVYIKKLEM